MITTVVGTAAPARPVAATGAAGHCRAGETILYACRFGPALGSVCAAPGRIAYHFGPAARPSLTINSTPDWGNVRIGRVTGGGGSQTHVRFTAAGHDYLVFEGVAGSLTATPGRRWSGIHVQRGDRALTGGAGSTSSAATAR